MALLELLLAVAAERPLTLDTKTEARLATGAEWDSNVERIAGDETSSDGLIRALADVATAIEITPLDRAFVSAVIGAKRFFAVDAEDLVVQDYGLATSHQVGPLEGGVTARLRSSTVRAASRDYLLRVGGGFIGLTPVEALELRAHADGSRLDLFSIPELSYGGPELGFDATLTLGRLRLRGSADYSERNYEGNSFQKVEVPEIGGRRTVLSRCDGRDGLGPPRCLPQLRSDQELAFGLRAFYRSTYQLGGEALVRVNRSNSETEDVDRYRFTLNASVPLPLGFILSALGVVQLNRGNSISESQQLLVDDNLAQNRLEAGLRRALSDSVFVELRYAVYSDQLADEEGGGFSRQTVYCGISTELSDRPELGGE